VRKGLTASLLEGRILSIEVNHLTKRYGAFEAVRDLSLEVPTGSLFAFLGANGAGEKTATSSLEHEYAEGQALRVMTG
jgi:ABC-type multidrug transport system ATPase subunit